VSYYSLVYSASRLPAFELDEPKAGARRLLSAGLWPISLRANAHASQIRAGDQALVYVASVGFIARVTFASDLQPLRRRDEFLELEGFQHAITLTNVVVWNNAVAIAQNERPRMSVRRGIQALPEAVFYSVVDRAESDPSTWRPWKPRPIQTDVDPSGWSYAIVESQDDREMWLTVSPWPWVDDAGSLRWRVADDPASEATDFVDEVSVGFVFPLVDPDRLVRQVGLGDYEPGTVLAIRTTFEQARNADSLLGVLVEVRPIDVTSDAYEALAAMTYAVRRAAQGAVDDAYSPIESTE
jgi:hypothetical protein